MRFFCFINGDDEIEKGAMRRFITILFLITALTCNSQNTVVGFIKDKSDDSFIPYCHVLVEQTLCGTICDSLGRFELSIPDSLVDGVMIVESLGYEDYSADVSSLTGTSQVIYLSRKTSDLTQFEISASREKKLKKKKVGSKKKKNNGNYMFNYGHEVALYFDNDERRKGYISKVKFFISEKGYPDTPFRVRVYYVNKKSGAPGKGILHQNTIASAVQGNEWVVVDLSSQGIKIPKDGFFVAMEWLPVSKGKGYTNKHNSKSEGQCLAGTHEFGVVSLTYIKNYLGRWVQTPVHPNTYRQLNAKVGAELLVYKQKYEDKLDPSNEELVPIKIE